MKIIDLSITTATAVCENSVVALGFFDGVHSGHRDLLLHTVEEARRRGARALVLTFSERGSAGLKNSDKRILSEHRRYEIFEELGIDCVVLMDFSQVKSMPHDEFVRSIIIGRCNASAAVCGFNYRYGAGAKGNSETLCAQMTASGGGCIVCPAFMYEGDTVSASRIKKCLLDGEIELANKMLDSVFSIEGTVQHGKALGREMGVPTANIAYPDGAAAIMHGVYATRVRVDGALYGAVTNVGRRPTLDDGEFINCESHIINYDGNLYGKEIKVEFCKLLREEKRFSSVDELKAQIEKDRKEAEKWLITSGQS